MHVFIARTAMVPSSVSPASDGDYRVTQIADDYRGAHADGYDYADYQADEVAWAEMVWEVAGTPLEGRLFLAAAKDWAGHFRRTNLAGLATLPRGKWCEAHVAGQIDRAIEIADGI